MCITTFHIGIVLFFDLPFSIYLAVFDLFLLSLLFAYFNRIAYL